jgi:transcription-repair coupling factor (superfamily II helicase)
VLIISPNSLAVERLHAEIEFFLDAGNRRVWEFPDWETLPYDQFSPYQSIISDRLACLSELRAGKQLVLLTSIGTLMHRLSPVSYIDGHTFVLKSGQQLDREAFCARLQDAGYRRVAQVMEHGDFALRGSLIDVFPMGCELPLRLDLLDDELESIRCFDPETQRSEKQLDEVDVLPAKEFACDDSAIASFRSSWRRRFEGNPANVTIYSDVSKGLSPAGIEYYLPLFFQQTASLLDYLPLDTLIVHDDGVTEAAEAFWGQVENRYESLRHDIEQPRLSPAELFWTADELAAQMRRSARIDIVGTGSEVSAAVEFDSVTPVQLPIDARAHDPLAIVKRFISEFPGRILIAAGSSGRRETILELFCTHDLFPTTFDGWQAFLASNDSLGVCVADLEQGAQIDSPQLALISEHQLFGERARHRARRRRTKRDPDLILASLTELSMGAPVVHEQHGVGRYQGLVNLMIDDVPGEFICLEYADGDKLYVPVSSLHLISRYSGVDPEHAPLHKLGSGAWQKAKVKAAKRIHDVAAELLGIYAKRAAKQGLAYHLDDDAYRAFCQGFPFEETPDQAEAIEAVIGDLNAANPMDRLVCGDVGFGKTEVAMRAAFVAVDNDYQVAVLVPTTLLAQQHYQTFKDRFADWPVHVEHLSRFRSRKDQEEVLRAISDGKVDIVIGTHKLLQPDVKFKRLGLLVIDEEHRFGVRQKERMKALRSEVDILTLTATPIPRTLNLALAGGRDLSIIATAPARRLAIKTFVTEKRDMIIREAILREIARGGQVYYLHNEVETIERVAGELEQLVPEARVRFAHGQMREMDLERVMLDFYRRRFNVLVCTTIIESGIDVATANTIVINRADRFGLAQLYQLRGRVGRSHHRAYAYLVIPSRKAITKDALKRLEAIESLEDLGIGFTLATHDLEIRGAGEILGEEQSGHIQEIGFSLYNELLHRAVAALRAGRVPVLEAAAERDIDIHIGVPALIPADFIPDVHVRLMLYKQIASAVDADELNLIREELIDRFGTLPPATQNLFRLTKIKFLADELRIRKIDVNRNGIRLRFRKQANVDAGKIIRLVQNQPDRYRLEGSEKLRYVAELPPDHDRFAALETLLNQIAGEQKNAA